MENQIPSKSVFQDNDHLLECPRCEHSVLSQRKTGSIIIEECHVCHGVWFDAGELETVLGRRFDYNRVLSRLLMKGHGARCPSCGEEMTLLEYNLNHFKVRIDHCEHCRGFFLDNGELEQLFTLEKYLKSRIPGPERPLPIFTHINGMDYPILRHYRSFDCERSADGLEASMGIYLFCLLTQSPVEVFNPRKIFPDLLLGLISLNIFLCLLLYLFPGQTQSWVFYTYGAVPAETFSMFGLIRLFTYSFLHPHIALALVNVYIIWIFGDNVFDVFMDHGRKRGGLLFTAFYFSLAAVAGLAHCLVFYFFGTIPSSDIAIVAGKVVIPDLTSSLIPLVGAGGIASGMLAAYWKLFPGSRLFQNLFVFPLKIPVAAYTFFWIAFNVAMGFYFDLPGPMSLSCHVGGFLTGWLLLDKFLPSRSTALSKK
ncbi:MAG: rhomboid family intramembrane serine protease [Candidatus Wallbacteria bacterium]|nr:rhomboid family intramembrane serine protease [Candidatus Wallbacteria bacterium]